MPFANTVILVALLGALAFLSQRCARQNQVIRQLNRQLAEGKAALEDSEQRGKLLFSANPYPMWIYDRGNLRFLDVNDAAVRSYGYSRQEFLSMTLMDIRPEEEASAFLELISQHPDEYTRAGVWRHLRKDGSTVFVQIMGFSFERGDCSQRIILALDVTKRHRIEEALRESERSLKALVDNAPCGVAQSLLEGNCITTLNPALLNILGGYSREEALELRISQQVYFDPKDRDRLIEVLRRSGKVKGWETSLKRRDGTLVPVRITGSLSAGANGPSELFSTYIEDITQQTALEQQVRQVQKLEAVGRLAGGMAHDFNNILVVIKLSTDMLLAQITPESAFSKPLLQISNAADRAAALTKQMLAFGRQQIMQTRVINLNSVVTETAHMLRRVIGEDIQLVTNLGGSYREFEARSRPGYAGNAQPRGECPRCHAAGRRASS